MFLHFSLILLLLYAVTYSVAHNYPPNQLTDNKEHDLIICSRLFHLNMIILKDVILKLKIAEKLQSKYKGAMGYELGLIVAGIIHIWKEMIATYQKMYYDQIPGVMYVGYQKIHGLYMELLVETDVFRKIAFENEKKKREKQKEMLHKMKEAHKKAYRDKFKKMKLNKTTITKPKGLRMGHRHTYRPGPSDSEYKRKLRMMKWAEQRRNYDYKNDGLDNDKEKELGRW